MKKLLHVAAVLLAAVIGLLPSSAMADTVSGNTTVSGIVVDRKNQPLPGAKVEIVGQNISAYTDLDGRFNIKCEPGAKEVLVTYPKSPEVKKRIKPDMTIRIGRSWRDSPERYQWFAGANVGIGCTSLFINDVVGYDGPFDIHHTFTVPTISVMGGRVKDVGWYAKAFITPGPGGISGGYYSGHNAVGFSDDYIKAKTFGAILGGMVRMGSPLYLCMGFGIASTDIYGVPKNQYDRLNWQIDFGFMYRIKDHFGVNLSFNAGLNNYFNYVAGSYANVGVSYFFNK